MAGFKEAVLIYLYVHLVAARDYCYTSGAYTAYCEDGTYCCEGNTRCCDDDIATGVIIGIVVGSLCFIACIVGFIVFVVKMATRKNGTVSSSPNYPQAPVTVATIQAHPPQGPVVGHQFGAQPPAYGQPGGAGPSINQPYPPPQPVYPPPPAQ